LNNLNLESHVGLNRKHFFCVENIPVYVYSQGVLGYPGQWPPLATLVVIASSN